MPVEQILVVDDEEPIREIVCSMLQNASYQCEQAASGVEALSILRNKPGFQLVLTDLMMPELDGAGLLEIIKLQYKDLPVVLVTAVHDISVALAAIRNGAYDYLLKPFSDERFEATMARVKSRLDERSLREFGQRIVNMVSATAAAGGLGTQERRWDRLVVKSGGSTRFIRVVDIDWIEAAGVYVTLHVAGKELLYRTALNELAERLDARRFVRVHRSAVVNIESIVRLEPISHGEFDVLLKDGSRTRVSRTFRAQLENRLGQSL